jgi:hypothetical protein
MIQKTVSEERLELLCKKTSKEARAERKKILAKDDE